MSTGIYREAIFGHVEVPQNDIDYWCGQCQFPIGPERCQTKKRIQQCWDQLGASARYWHILHECPFAHLGQECRCNDFISVEAAFISLGLKYKKQ